MNSEQGSALVTADVETGTPAPRLVPLLQVPEVRPWTTVRWLRRAIQRGWLPHYRLRGAVWFDVGDIDAYAAANRVDAHAS